MTDKLLDKIKKLNAHAESAAQIGNEAEAQAFAAAVQRLLVENKLSMTEVELHAQDQANPFQHEAMDWAAYDLPKKQKRVWWSENLGSLVARHNFCKQLIHMHCNRVSFIGRREDVKICEYTFATLYKLAEKVSDGEYVKFFYECREQGNVTRARGFRASFLEGFISRLGARLASEQKKIYEENQVGSGNALLRLDQHKVQLNKFIQEVFPGSRGVELKQGTGHNFEGYQRGRQSADRLELRKGLDKPVSEARRLRT